MDKVEFIIQSEYLLRILTASICGSLIGYERESRMKTAGIRTHIIVALASSLIMIVSKYGFTDILGQSGIGLDPSRIGAGIVSAIGFLGAGVIFTRKQAVTGLTTAAGIWATVGVGMAIGTGLYFIGIVTSIMIIIVQFVFHKKWRWMKPAVIEQFTLLIQQENDIDVLVDETFSKKNIEILSLKARKLQNGVIELKVHLKFPDNYSIIDMVKFLRDNPNISGIDV